jgi:hypothetical protein
MGVGLVARNGRPAHVTRGKTQKFFLFYFPFCVSAQTDKINNWLLTFESRAPFPTKFKIQKTFSQSFFWVVF